MSHGGGRLGWEPHCCAHSATHFNHSGGGSGPNAVSAAPTRTARLRHTGAGLLGRLLLPTRCCLGAQCGRAAGRHSCQGMHWGMGRTLAVRRPKTRPKTALTALNSPPPLFHLLQAMVQVLVVFGDKATLIGGCKQSTTVAELKGQARALASLRIGTPRPL